MRRIFVFGCFVILLSLLEVSAQVTPGRQTIGDSTAQKQQRESVENSRWNDEVAKRADGLDLDDSDDSEEFIRRKLRAKESLKPEKKYKKTYAGFLKQAKAGLIKISGPKDCRVIDLQEMKSDDPCVASFIPGGGKAFSFRQKEHSSFKESDLQRTETDFVAQGSFVFGLLVSLADASIDSISSQSEAVTSVLQFTFSGRVEEIQEQEKDLANGKTIGGMKFFRQLPIEQYTTYLLRSIACPVVVKTGADEKNKKVLFSDKKRFDVVVAFRVVEEHTDGSLTLIWKEIHRQNSPTIEVEQAN